MAGIAREVVIVVFVKIAIIKHLIELLQHNKTALVESDGLVLSLAADREKSAGNSLIRVRNIIHQKEHGNRIHHGVQFVAAKWTS